jgi:hypothetical protein
MRSIVFFLLLCGIILVVIGFVKSNQQCPPPLVEFRYIPRTFEQEQDNPIPVSSIFASMFEDQTAWDKVQGYADYMSRDLREKLGLPEQSAS